MTSPTESSQWALLPEDLLQEITQRLPKPCDYVRFGAVCKGWHSFAHKSYKQKHLLNVHQNFPLLLIPTEDQERRGLYNIAKGMVYDQFQLYLPKYARCCGSSYGWLFFVDKVNESTLELILINPFLGDSKTIKLPPITFCDEDDFDMMDEFGVTKAILSKDPYVSPHDYEVVALYGIYSRLAHYKSGDKFWSYTEKIKIEMEILADIIFYKNLILAVDRYNWMVNFTLEPKRRIQSTDCSPWYLKWNTLRKQLEYTARNYAGNAYLVENSKGNLLLVRRHFWFWRDELKRLRAAKRAERAAERRIAERAREIEEGGTGKFEESDESEEEYEPHLTVDFKVYRLSFSSTGKSLRKVRTKTLDWETLFLGDNSSISIPASKYPQLCPNSIYYTDYYPDIYIRNLQFGSIDTGIFNVENGNFDKHYVPSFSTKGTPAPIFVVPQ